MRKNIINNKNSEINDLYKLLIIAYKKIKIAKIKKYENLILILFHELMYFFSSLMINKKIQKKHPLNKILVNQNIKFGKRKGKSIFVKKGRKKINVNLIKLLNNSLLLFNKKKIFYGSAVETGKIGKLKMFIFAFLKGYKIELIDLQKISLPKIKFQKNILNNLLLNIEKEFKLKINAKMKNDIFSFINKIYLKEKKLSTDKENFYLLGSTANIYNRLNSIKGLQNKNKVYVFGHGSQTGMIDTALNMFDDFSLCTHYVGFMKEKIFKKIKNKNYLDIDNIRPNYIENKSFFKNKKKINSIFFDTSLISKDKGLYIPRRFSYYASVSPNECLDYVEYLKWQNFLINNIDKLDYKIHPKDKVGLRRLKKLVSFDPQKIKSGSLKNIINNYKYLVVDFVSSTAFAEIANSKIPIIYFDVGIDSLTTFGEEAITERVLKVKVDQKKSAKYFNLNTIVNSGKHKQSNRKISKLTY